MKNFFSWFGYVEASPSPSREIAVDTGHIINESIDTIDSLTMKRAQFLAKAEDALNSAKKLPKTEKTKRLGLMKQHQQYQRRAEVYTGMISNMEQTAQSLDTAAVSIQLAKTMKAAQLQMRDQLEQVQIDDIDTVADDLDDTMRDVNEMATALSRPLGIDSVDDDELLGQLDEWDAAEVELPTVPTARVPTAAPVKE